MSERLTAEEWPVGAGAFVITKAGTFTVKAVEELVAALAAAEAERDEALALMEALLRRRRYSMWTTEGYDEASNASENALVARWRETRSGAREISEERIAGVPISEIVKPLDYPGKETK